MSRAGAADDVDVDVANAIDVDSDAGKQADVALLVDAGGADLERRFGGLRRLYGEAGYAAVRRAHVAVVGLGGVGSWAAEALARSGVASLTLVDFDHVCESNINRQVQALGATVGQAKGEALRERIADIHPGCAVTVVDDFVTAPNWPALLQCAEVDALVDACDQVKAKAVLAAWGARTGVACVAVGAAGGKRRPQLVDVADLAEVSHDPLLAALRQRLRQQHGGARAGAMGLRCVFSREPVTRPAVTGSDGQGGDAEGAACAVDGSLNCHGYGSVVTVTATFGMVAAAQAIDAVITAAARRSARALDT